MVKEKIKTFKQKIQPKQARPILCDLDVEIISRSTPQTKLQMLLLSKKNITSLSS